MTETSSHPPQVGQRRSDKHGHTVYVLAELTPLFGVPAFQVEYEDGDRIRYSAATLERCYPLVETREAVAA